MVIGMQPNKVGCATYWSVVSYIAIQQMFKVKFFYGWVPYVNKFLSSQVSLMKMKQSVFHVFTFQG